MGPAVEGGEADTEALPSKLPFGPHQSPSYSFRQWDSTVKSPSSRGSFLLCAHALKPVTMLTLETAHEAVNPQTLIRCVISSHPPAA